MASQRCHLLKCRYLCCLGNCEIKLLFAFGRINLLTYFTHLCRDPYLRKEGIEAEQLRVFESVREITGFLSVDAHDDNFTSLSFLRNLRVIHGRQTYG